jgi:mevalonate kinase
MVKLISCAKWILSGEHAVIRGKKALAFPLLSHKSSISLFEGERFSLEADSEESMGMVISLFKKACEFTGISVENMGRMVMSDNIPVGVGFGSSAAICANIAKVFKYYGFTGDVLGLARHLEDEFHGKSSGLDVAVALTNKSVVFDHNKIVGTIEPSFWPHMILTYSGEKSMTSNCVEYVRKVFLKNERLALELDDMMDLASSLCEDALKNADFNGLRDGIKLACEVFYGWGLCHEPLRRHIDSLLSDGAAAVKPIGSGLGGYVLSLWDKQPKCDICLTLEKPYM